MPTQRRRSAAFTVPGLEAEDAATVAAMLQERLVALTDLSLTLKHVHWNVVGPHFIAVHPPATFVATVHPSAVLRAEDRDGAYAQFVADLTTAARALAP
jgi:hypothetical protein